MAWTLAEKIQAFKTRLSGHDFEIRLREDAFGENEFVGRRLRLGNKVVIAVTDRDPRCKMIAIDPETAEENRAIFGHMSDAHDGAAGVYCAVMTEGKVRTGDATPLSQMSALSGDDPTVT